MKSRWCVAALFSLVLAACGGNGSSSTTDRDYRAVLEQTVTQVIQPTYERLGARATSLREAVVALRAAPDARSLATAKAAWVAMRVPWEQSEAFLFGPVADLALDGSLDSWPVDRVQLDEVLASGMALTKETVKANLGGGLKGFHTIEYLLWGAESKKAPEDLRARELEYLVALAEALEADAIALRDAWLDPTSGYGRAFYLAGQPGGRLYRQVDAVQQLLNGMVGICDEVANGKIADPYKAQDPMLVESQFSWNSIADFADNLRSVRNVYLGSLDGSSQGGISSMVQRSAPDVDRRLRGELDAAVAAILAIAQDGQAFRDAIKDPAKKVAIENAQAKVRVVMLTLQRDVTPLLIG